MKYEIRFGSGSERKRARARNTYRYFLNSSAELRSKHSSDFVRKRNMITFRKTLLKKLEHVCIKR